MNEEDRVSRDSEAACEMAREFPSKFPSKFARFAGGCRAPRTMRPGTRA
ncbi:hypothetical protein [Paraburkholderia azotifigens]